MSLKTLEARELLGQVVGAINILSAVCNVRTVEWDVWGACVESQSIEIRLELVLAKYLNPQPPTPLKRRIRNWDEFGQTYPELTEVVIDETEQVTQRPRGKKGQKPYYSNKQKRHTIKTQIVVTKNGRVIWVSDSVSGGRVHDYSLLKRSRVMEGLPEQVIKRVDLGYQGVETDYPNHTVVIPHKKPRNQALTKAQKQNTGLWLNTLWHT